LKLLSPGFIGHAHFGMVFLKPDEVVQSSLGALGTVPLAQQL
jgi:hypothetical protein